MTEPSPPRLYGELAHWWPLLSAPADYILEAETYRRALCDASLPTGATLLELGSGGGNSASHLKRHFRLTLVDRSPGMITVSRALNPECEHTVGDMRAVRLDRLFDGVFVHDAIGYMTTEADLLQVFHTAHAHCRPGGVALFVPDCVRETFRPFTSHGGHDGPGRALRYLEWVWDPDPADSTYAADFACLLRDADGTVRLEHDRHSLGLFPRETWSRLLERAGFSARPIRFSAEERGGDATEGFVAIRQATIRK
ncbi:MAG: class I SAM-dependent methyltransferase [Planctomycetes bacterium]|nr:class I SAM-dependent methyltransferase [Planctomycetota bacterium]